MKSFLSTVTLVCVALILAGCQPTVEKADPAAQAAAQAEDVAAIEASNAKLEAAFDAGDAAALANLFTDDAITMPPNTPAVVGKEAIRSRFQTTADRLTMKVTLSLEESEVAGDWAFVRGSYANTYTPKAGGEPIESNGKSLAILKRQSDGSWKFYRVMQNSNLPLPGTGG